jgi:superfamily II DNA or RNA helicase
MNASNYIGHSGYTIYKECLSEVDKKFIRDSLMVSPYKHNSPIKITYPVFLESKNKFYIPKYFGIEHFGEPDEYTFSTEEKINLSFMGELYNYQKPIVDAFMKTIRENYGGGLLDIPCGYGKTAMALYILSRLNVKTLVIVHKGFLLNQWKERIAEFLPNARIGTIQRKIVDIENKDIVIGMVQSLSMKEYKKDMFNGFGLTIVDECHRISSKVFSRSLNKIVTKYTLGLSATMDRKDGLTYVFKMFLGDVVYSVDREKEDLVVVKAIEYKSNDFEFEKVVLDHKGNPMFSTMITKICEYNHRTEFILTTLTKELNAFPNQQVMILGQNKSILTYIHDAIVHRNIASVGYYVGGMKEIHLKESEKKTVIVATYAMASEGLDIKTLTTLMLITPRTDITQSVGRILRVKHERPLIIDFVDTHDMFRRQYKKRLSFYRSNNYTILESDNYRYVNDAWNDISKSRKKESKCLIRI